MWRLERELGSHVGGAPGQGHATAAMTVVVNQSLVAEGLALHQEAGGTERPQSGGLADNFVRADHELWQDAFSGFSRGAGEWESGGGRAKREQRSPV